MTHEPLGFPDSQSLVRRQGGYPPNPIDWLGASIEQGIPSTPYLQVENSNKGRSRVAFVFQSVSAKRSDSDSSSEAPASKEKTHSYK